MILMPREWWHHQSTPRIVMFHNRVKEISQNNILLICSDFPLGKQVDLNHESKMSPQHNKSIPQCCVSWPRAKMWILQCGNAYSPTTDAPCFSTSLMAAFIVPPVSIHWSTMRTRRPSKENKCTILNGQVSGHYGNRKMYYQHIISISKNLFRLSHLCILLWLHVAWDWL